MHKVLGSGFWVLPGFLDLDAVMITLRLPYPPLCLTSIALALIATHNFWFKNSGLCPIAICMSWGSIDRTSQRLTSSKKLELKV